MTPKKQPTNADLMKEIQADRAEHKEMRHAITALRSDVDATNHRHEVIDIAKEAVEQERKRRQVEEDDVLYRQEKKTKIDLNTKLIVLLGAVTALVILLIQLLKK